MCAQEHYLFLNELLCVAGEGSKLYSRPKIVAHPPAPHHHTAPVAAHTFPEPHKAGIDLLFRFDPYPIGADILEVGYMIAPREVLEGDDAERAVPMDGQRIPACLP